MAHLKRILANGYEQFIHASGIATNILIICDDEVLVAKRPDTVAILPGFLHPIGGHVEFDQNPAQAAIKEVHEETGIVIDKLKLKGIVTELNSLNQDENWLIFHFIAEVKTKENNESPEGKLIWLPIDEFKASQKLFPSVKGTVKYLLDGTDNVVFATFSYKSPKDFDSAKLEHLFVTSN